MFVGGVDVAMTPVVYVVAVGVDVGTTPAIFCVCCCCFCVCGCCFCCDCCCFVVVVVVTADVAHNQPVTIVQAITPFAPGVAGVGGWGGVGGVLGAKTLPVCAKPLLLFCIVRVGVVGVVADVVAVVALVAGEVHPRRGAVRGRPRGVLPAPVSRELQDRRVEAQDKVHALPGAKVTLVLMYTSRVEIGRALQVPLSLVPLPLPLRRPR